MGWKEQQFLVICPDLLFFASKKYINHFYNSEESIVIAEFIALRFFGISSLQIS